MKKLMYMVSLLFCCAFFTACSDDDWSNEDAPLQNVYYFGFRIGLPRPRRATVSRLMLPMVLPLCCLCSSGANTSVLMMS